MVESDINFAFPECTEGPTPQVSGVPAVVAVKREPVQDPPPEPTRAPPATPSQDGPEAGAASGKCRVCDNRKAGRKAFCREHQQAYDNIYHAVFKGKDQDSETVAAWNNIFKNSDFKLQKMVLGDYAVAVRNLSVMNKRQFRVNLLQYTHTHGTKKSREKQVCRIGKVRIGEGRMTLTVHLQCSLVNAIHL